MIRYMFLLVFAMGAVGLSAQTRTPEQQQWVAMLQGNALAGRGAAKPGFALYYATSGEVKQPYLVYVPKRCDGRKKTPLVVFLHGAVLALDSFQYFRPELAREPVFAAAEKSGVLALFPLARQDFKWSGNSKVCNNILSMISATEAIYNVDDSRVYLGGQSMGGNASYWFMVNHPEMFAGFYAFSSLPSVTDLDAMKANHFMKPLITVNAADDGNFSDSEMQGKFNRYKHSLTSWKCWQVTSGGHRFLYHEGGDKQASEVIEALLKWR